MAGRWAGAAEARPGVPSSPAGRPGGPSGWSRDRGDPATTRPALLERPQQLCPRAGSPGAPAGPRREFGERRGFACLVLCVRTHTTAHACCLSSRGLSSPSHSYPRFALRGHRGPRGWPGRRWEGEGLLEWCGSRGPCAVTRPAPLSRIPFARGWGRRDRPSRQAKGPTSPALHFSCHCDSCRLGAKKGG